MKKKQEELIPMKCVVCTECYRLSDRFGNRCHYGGPYNGYIIIKNNAPVA